MKKLSVITIYDMCEEMKEGHDTNVSEEERANINEGYV